MKKAGRIVSAAVTAVAVAIAAVAVALCVMFPNKYSGELCAAADEFGLDRDLVRSVVWAESRFDRRAVSDKGAVGLMQLMPATFDECAAQLGLPSGQEAMFDAGSSLRCGCLYLSQMLVRFGGNTTAALMAYNAGERNAERFLAGEPIFAETRAYLERISRARKVYGAF